MPSHIQPCSPSKFAPMDWIASIPSKIKEIAKKTWQLVRSLFSSFTSCCPSAAPLLTSRDITWLRTERRHAPTLQIGRVEPILPKPPISSTETAAEAAPGENSVEPQHSLPYNKYDDALEDLRAFARDMSILTVDVAFEQNIADRVDSLQTMAPSLPPVIKSLAKLFVEMGDKAAKPLYKKLAAQKEELIDPILRKLFKTLMKPDLLLLKRELAEHLRQLIAANHPEMDQTVSIELIINWVALPEAQRPAIESLASEISLAEPVVELLVDAAQRFWDGKHLSSRTQLFNDLSKQISEELKESSVPFLQRLDRDYIEPVLNWLLLSDQRKPLNSCFIPAGRYQEELIDKVFERAISLLVEKKIDHFAQLLENTIQSRLGEITHEMLRINAERFADYFSERIACLIDAAPYTEMFDQVIQKDLAAHVSGVISAENEVAFWKEKLEKCKRTALSDPKKESDIALKEEALSYLATVEQHGSEELYLEHKRLEAYSRHPFCIQPMRELINQSIDLSLEGKDPEQFQRANEKAIYESLAERLLDLMMPSKKALDNENGVIEIDPFAELWDRLYFPEEFNELIRYCEELTSEFITPDTMNLLGHLKQPIIEITKNIFKSTAKDLLRKHLGTFVKKSIEAVIQPESLNALTAQSILPTLNKKLIATFAKQELSRNTKIFLPLFTELAVAPQEMKEEKKQALFLALMRHMIGRFKQFDPENFSVSDGSDTPLQLSYKGIEAEEWMGLLLPIIDEIDAQFRIKHSSQPTFTAKELEGAFLMLFKDQSAENNPEIGKLIMDLIFRVGGMKNEWLVDWFVKDHISTASTTMLAPWRVSHEQLIRVMSSALRDKFLSADLLKRIFAGQPDSAPRNVDAKLKHQIDVTSRLAYDMIIGIAKEKGAIANYGVKKLLGTDSDYVNAQINMIYRRVLGNRLANENLILQCCDSLFAALNAASETVRLRDNIKIRQIAAEV